MTKGLSHTHTCIHSPRDTPSLEAPTYHWAGFPLLYSRTFLLCILNTAVLLLLFYYFYVRQCHDQDSENANIIIFVSVALGIYSPSFRSESLQDEWMTPCLIGWESHWSLLHRPASQPALQAASGSAQAPAHGPSFPSAARLGFQLCVMFILSLKAPPHPARPPFSEQQTATPVSNSGFRIFSSKAPAPAHSAHPGWANFSSVSALVAPMLSSIRPLITGHTSLLNSDSPMMRRTVIYVSLEPKCLTENRHRIAVGWMGEYMNRRMDARMSGWIKRDSWEPPGIQRVKQMWYN